MYKILVYKDQLLNYKIEEIAAIESDSSAASQLSSAEQITLIRLLQKIYTN